MSENEYEQFIAAFGCPPAMAEPTVTRIRQRLGSEVPMPEILAAIKKIAPSRLSTDTLVVRLQKDALIRSTKPVRSKASGDSAKPKVKAVSTKSQISAILKSNWDKATAQSLTVPNLTIDKFVRTAQSAAGEPKPTVARVLEAVKSLAEHDVVITPNLVADEIIETDK